MRRFFSLGVCGLAALAGCTAPSDATTTESDHTEGEYVHAANNPFFWAGSIPHAELSYPNEDLSKVVPASDKLAARMQLWADRIDDLVRAKVRASGQELAAPKPVLSILPSAATFNAWASGAYACLGVPFRGVAGSPTSHTLVSASGMYGFDAPEGMSCGKPAEWPAASELVRLWPEQSPTCPLSFEGGGLSSTCIASSSVDTAVVTMTRYVHFTTLLLSSVDEMTAVTVLAHELGHYYRAHSSTLTEHKYRFWYEHDPALPGRPLPMAQGESLEQHYRNVFAAPKAITVPGAAYHARLHKVVALIAAEMKSRTETGFACAGAVPKIGPWVSAFTMPMEAGITPADETGYLAFERELSACAPRLRVAYDVPAPDLLDRGRFELALASTGFARSAPLSGATLDAMLTELGAQATVMDVEEKDMLDKLREGKIGLYTTEQEADDIALDLSTKLGISSGEFLGAWIKFMRATEAVYGPSIWNDKETGEASPDRCEALIRANFTEPGPDGTPVPVRMTLGSLESNHHGECYRAYNLWRENNAHKYVTQGTFLPPVGPSWPELAKHAASLHAPKGTAPVPPPGVTTPPDEIAPADVPALEEDGPGRGRSVRSVTTKNGCSASPETKGSSVLPLLVLVLALASRRIRRVPTRM